MRLYNREWTRRELEARIGRIEQIGGVQRVRGSEGIEDGVELIRVRTGAGLAFEVLPSRGMDIGMATYGDVPLCWLAPGGGIAHPAYYEPNGNGWLRTAAGGLLMTCGLMNVGNAGEDDGRHYGLHGRAHHTPARHVAVEAGWIGDEYEMVVKGTMDETTLHGDQLRLTREIRSRLGSNAIRIRDRVENTGFTHAAHMLLYHFNFGFPLLDAHSRVQLPAATVTARETDTPLDDFDRWQLPEEGYRERVYLHQGLGPGSQTASISNDAFPLTGGAAAVRVSLSWNADTLPVLVQWKMPGQGTHVLGLEPGTCGVEGRARAKERGALLSLAPGETRSYELLFDVQ